MNRVIQIVCVVAFVTALGVGRVSAGLGYLDDIGIAAWGNDAEGQVSDTPTGTGFATVAADGAYSLALKTDGSLVAWGSDYYGQVSGMPTGTDFAAVSGGSEYGLALKTDGSLVSWGRDAHGTVSDTPTGTGFAAVAGGGWHSLALKTDGSLVAWGSVIDTPEGNDFAAVAAGTVDYNLALKTDGSLVSWGNDSSGRVTETPTGIGFAAVAAAYRNGLALKTDGSLVTWGSDAYSMVSGTPTGTDFTAVAACRDHSLALKTDGSLVSWGDDSNGQVSDTPRGTGFTAVAAGNRHCLAIGPAMFYDDLLVTGAGPTALLNRDVTVRGNATVETAMAAENGPTMSVEGVTTFANGGSVVLGEGDKLEAPILHIEDGGLVEVDGGTLDFQESSIQTGGRLRVNGDFYRGAPLLLEGGTVEAIEFRLLSGGSVSGHGMIDAEFWCDDIDSFLTADGGTLTVGKADSYNGFAMPQGEIVINPGATLELLIKGFVSLPVHFTLDSGTFAAPNGVLVPPAYNLPASGTVTGRVSAAFGSTIDATGDLVLGDANAYDGFFSDGSLITGVHTVTINDRNQAVLGSMTQLGDGGSGGTLVADNGLAVELGKNIVGRGTIDTPNDPLTPLTNNGAIIGDSPGAIELTGYVKGIGTLENVTISGTLSPGSSPVRFYATNLEIAASGKLLMELGGLSGGIEYDQLDVTGELRLGGTLQVSLIGGFVPDFGDMFDILDFDNLNGTEFDILELPGLVGRKAWDTSNLYTTGLLGVVTMMEGDTDGDWDVDADDYVNLVAQFGGPPGADSADFNGDNFVDLEDFAIQRGNFGFGVVSAPDAEFGATTPEPATLTLLTLGGLALIRRRKRG